MSLILGLGLIVLTSVSIASNTIPCSCHKLQMEGEQLCGYEILEAAEYPINCDLQRAYTCQLRYHPAKLNDNCETAGNVCKRICNKISKGSHLNCVKNTTQEAKKKKCIFH